MVPRAAPGRPRGDEKRELIFVNSLFNPGADKLKLILVNFLFYICL